MSQPLTLRRWKRVEYEKLVDLGLFHCCDPVELIGGQLVVAELQGSYHATAVGAADDALRAILPPGWIVRAQMPVALDEDSEPEPDLAVVPGVRADYRGSHPARPVLALEVAESSLDFDREHKGSLYTRAGVVDYWIVNLVDRVLEVYRDPAPDPSARPWPRQPSSHPWRCRQRRSRSPTSCRSVRDPQLPREASALSARLRRRRLSRRARRVSSAREEPDRRRHHPLPGGARPPLCHPRREPAHRGNAHLRDRRRHDCLPHCQASRNWAGLGPGTQRTKAVIDRAWLVPQPGAVETPEPARPEGQGA